MKIYLIATFCLLQSYYSNSQSNKMFRAGVPVKVKNWDGLVLMIVDPVMDSMKDSLIAQIGEVEFEKFKNNSTVFKWPSAVAGKIWKKGDSMLIREHDKKLSRLHVYKIASYQHVFQGTKWDRYAVLRVPYNENRDWDQAVKWDTLYFVINEKDVDEIPND